MVYCWLVPCRGLAFTFLSWVIQNTPFNNTTWVRVLYALEKSHKDSSYLRYVEICVFSVCFVCVCRAAVQFYFGRSFDQVWMKLLHIVHLLCATLSFEYASNQRYQFIGIKWMFYRNRLMRHKHFKSHSSRFFSRDFEHLYMVFTWWLNANYVFDCWSLNVNGFGSFVLFFWKVGDLCSKIRDSLWKVNTWTFQYMLFFMQSLLIVSECTVWWSVFFFSFLINIHGALCSVLLVPPLRYAVRLVYEYR